jgi:DNA-binding MarR family transcriptional regulator
MPFQRNRSQHVAWRLFLNAHALLSKRIDRALLAAGCISFDTYDVLITLSEAKGYRLRMSELADATFFSNSGISRRVARLEKEGLLYREGCESDGRVFYAVLSDAGKSALHEAWPVYAGVIEKDFGSVMNAAEARELSRLLKGVVEKIEGKSVDLSRTEEPPC